MSQRDSRLIGGLYRVGVVLTSGGIVTSSTAYNRNTNDMVGLYLIEFPPTFHVQEIQEALRLLAPRQRITSPHVLHVQGWGTDGNRVYIATDPARGVSLRHMQDTENIDLTRALSLSKQIAQGLKALHEQGIVGLDLRPELITVEVTDAQDRVQIDDIGLRPVLQSLGYTNTQMVHDLTSFDPRYAAPEYINTTAIGPWSDTYQVGLLLFELLTGRPPFVGRTLAETGVMQCTESVPRIQRYTHNAPISLQDLLDHALAKQPMQRFTTAQALLDALDAISLPSRTPFQSGSRSVPSSGGLTREIAAIDEDVSLFATIIKKPTGSEHVPVTLPTEEGVYAYLCSEQDGKEVSRIPILGASVVVGRVDPKRGVKPDIDLSALDPNMTISRQHARIRFEQQLFYIEDLKSRNKTRLGELPLTPLQEELLHHNDTIRFGNVRLIFKIPGMSTSASLPIRKQS